MGMIRGALLSLVCILFLNVLFLGGLFLTLDLSLEEDLITTQLSSVVKDITDKDGAMTKMINSSHAVMVLQCKNQTSIELRSNSGPRSISCDIVNQGPDAIVNSFISDLVTESYLKSYECSFTKCITESPFFIVSKQSKDYFHSKFYLCMIISLVLFLLILFLVETKSNAFIVSGILIFLSSLPFIKFSAIMGFLINTFFARILGAASSMLSKEDVSNVLSILFVESKTVFLWMFILGIFVFLIGIFLKLLKVGFKISKLFHKEEKPASKEDVEKLVKERIEKEKKNSVKGENKKEKKDKKL